MCYYVEASCDIQEKGIIGKNIENKKNIIILMYFVFTMINYKKLIKLKIIANSNGVCRTFMYMYNVT